MRFAHNSKLIIRIASYDWHLRISYLCNVNEKAYAPNTSRRRPEASSLTLIIKIPWKTQKTKKLSRRCSSSSWAYSQHSSPLSAFRVAGKGVWNFEFWILNCRQSRLEINQFWIMNSKLKNSKLKIAQRAIIQNSKFVIHYGKNHSYWCH